MYRRCRIEYFAIRIFCQCITVYLDAIGTGVYRRCRIEYFAMSDTRWHVCPRAVLTVSSSEEVMLVTSEIGTCRGFMNKVSSFLLPRHDESI